MRTKLPKSGTLNELDVSLIRRNEHNPRLVFRADELEELAASIRDIGVQVPISVFRDGSHYVLVDGERRWRACQMLNAKKVPAIIYPKPDAVQNIVFMFNIHRFRKDWDPLPTAMKLEELKELVEQREGKTPSEAELAALTGMTRGAVRRCKLIMEIPVADRRSILKELEKPEHERRITTDLYIETQRSVRTVGRYLPGESEIEAPLRSALIRKYKDKIINNVVDMRLVAKISRAASRGVQRRTVISALRMIIDDPKATLDDAYSRVAWAYDIRALTTQAKSLASLVKDVAAASSEIDADTWKVLEELHDRLKALLKNK